MHLESVMQVQTIILLLSLTVEGLPHILQPMEMQLLHLTLAIQQGTTAIGMMEAGMRRLRLVAPTPSGWVVCNPLVLIKWLPLTIQLL